jgi:hypothetical protein
MRAGISPHFGGSGRDAVYIRQLPRPVAASAVERLDEKSLPEFDDADANLD